MTDEFFGATGSWLGRQTSLYNLALTCRQFNGLATGHLFHEPLVGSEYLACRGRGVAQGSRALLRTLQEFADLANRVKTLTLFGNKWHFGEDRYFHLARGDQRSKPSAYQALTLCPQVKNLRLVHVGSELPLDVPRYVAFPPVERLAIVNLHEAKPKFYCPVMAKFHHFQRLLETLADSLRAIEVTSMRLDADTLPCRKITELLLERIEINLSHLSLLFRSDLPCLRLLSWKDCTVIVDIPAELAAVEWLIIPSRRRPYHEPNHIFNVLPRVKNTLQHLDLRIGGRRIDF